MEKFTAHKDKIKLVMSDVVMPRKSGKVACEEIREMDKTMKFLFVSGHTREEFGPDDVSGTGYEIMMKPLLPFELLGKIREMLA